MSYRERVVDDELQQRLGSAGAVLVEGPKACGKTATAQQVAGSKVFLDVDAQARAALAVDPSLVLDGAPPRLLDEWQVEPDLWNHVRRQVDEDARPGQFILTGSAVPADDAVRHTGAGRFSRLRMRPMSLLESGHSTGRVSLRKLLEGAAPRSPDPGLSFEGLTECLTTGGWPAFLDRGVAASAAAVRDYLDQVLRVDVERVDQTRRDPVKLGRLAASLARNVATEVSVARLADDVSGAETGDGRVTRNTVSAYLDALERLMIVEDQPAWAPHLRSRVRVRGSVKRHFVDPSLAVAALRAGPGRLRADLELTGFLFESLVVRDLRVYSQPLDGTVRHYRDSSGLEVDAIVECADGSWGAVEVKLGQQSVDGAAASLLRFADVVDTHRCGEPGVLAVLTASGYGYRRDDGVAVVPIGALGP